MQHKKLKLLIIFLISIHSSVWADDWFERKSPHEPELGQKDLFTYAPSVRVLVPHESPLRDKILRVDGVPYEIREFIDLPGLYAEESVDIEVVEHDGRILDYQHRTIEPELLQDLHIRRLHFDLKVGYRSTNPDTWKKHGIDPTGTIMSFGAHYFPNQWGFKAGMQRVRRSGKNAANQLVEYNSTEIPILIGYDWVPFAHSQAWRQWQLRSWMGILKSQHTLKTHMDHFEENSTGNNRVVDVTTDEHLENFGFYLGLEWMRPVTDRVWFSLEYALIHRKLHWEKPKFSAQRPIHDLKTGLYFSI